VGSARTCRLRAAADASVRCVRPGSLTDRVQQEQRYLTPAPSATNNITFYVSQYFTDLHIPSIRFSAFWGGGDNCMFVSPWRLMAWQSARPDQG
jgi:hypothetical protein